MDAKSKAKDPKQLFVYAIGFNPEEDLGVVDLHENDLLRDVVPRTIVGKGLFHVTRQDQVIKIFLGTNENEPDKSKPLPARTKLEGDLWNKLDPNTDALWVELRGGGGDAEMKQGVL